MTMRSSFPVLALPLLLLLCLCFSFASGQDEEVRTAHTLTSKKRGFEEGEVVDVFAAPFTSISKVVSLPYAKVFPCTNATVSDKLRGGGIGQAVLGSRQHLSLYRLRAGIDQQCAYVCSEAFNSPPTPEDKKRMKRLNKWIKGLYRGNLYIDRLPFADELHPARTGYPLGALSVPGGEGEGEVINNFLHFTIFYVKKKDAGGKPLLQVVYARVFAESVARLPCVATGEGLRGELRRVDGSRIDYGYSVVWSEAPEGVNYRDRFRSYIVENEEAEGPHALSTSLAVLGTLALSLLLYIRIVTIVRRDLQVYEDKTELEEQREDSGWRLVNGDVFRKPPRAGLLATAVGTGVQLLTMLLSVLICAVVGLLGHADQQGRLATIVLVFFALGAFMNGFTTATFANFLKIRSLKIVVFSALLYPGAVAAVYLVLNGIHLVNGAASSLGIWGVSIVLFLWLCVSVPLCVVGGVLGYRREPMSCPVRVNTIPRTIPSQPSYLAAAPSCVIASLLPFIATAMEITSLISSVWNAQSYDLYLFFFVNMLMALLLTGVSTVTLTYNRLANLDYQWWWPAFGVGLGYGFWCVVSTVIFYLFASSVSGVMGAMLYFGYMLMATTVLALAFGSAGFIASFFFVRYIYSNVKMD